MKINLPPVVCFFALLFLVSCKPEKVELEPSTDSNFKAKNVIIIVVDGVRFIDSWNNSQTENIPNQRALKDDGVFFNSFFNDQNTYTISGHGAICTGTYEYLENGGGELPSYPSIFQRYLAETYLPPSKSWVIAGKEKLQILGNSKNIHWRNRFMPSVDAIDRADSLTLKRAKEILLNNEPTLSLVHFRGPDKYGHLNDWNNYISSIQNADKYVNELWNFIQSNNHYKNQTALFVTSDHGRHLDQVDSGFVGHGDRCDGCRHIYLLALGPDFGKGKFVDTHHGQIDIAPTVAKILNFSWEGQGKPITELVN